jgi:hypothetical protein
MILTESVDTFSFNEEEINQVCRYGGVLHHPSNQHHRQIVVDEKDRFLAAADDHGDIRVIDLQHRCLYKKFRTLHKNVSDPASKYRLCDSLFGTHLI